VIAINETMGPILFGRGIEAAGEMPSETGTPGELVTQQAGTAH